MKTQMLSLLILGMGIASCQKDMDQSALTKKEQDSLLSVFQDRKIASDPLVDLSSSAAKPSLKSSNASNTVRDSVWANQQGRTYFVESSNIMVSDETADIIYPGAILRSKDIISSYSFIPLSARDYDPLPIRASLSVPGTNVSGTIAYPSLDETRDFLGEVLGRQGNVTQINNFSYTSSEFKDYNELKYSFGANVDVAKIANAALTGGGTKISNKTGIIAKFVQENFTLDMSLPRRTELIGVADADALQTEYAPSYVSSVTYGRMGIFMAETDVSYEEFNIAFKAGVNIGVVKADAHVSSEQKAILDRAKITIYMKFGPGPAYARTVEGYEQFKAAILEGAAVTSTSYGGPISFRMRNLKDFSLFKTIFKIDVSN